MLNYSWKRLGAEKKCLCNMLFKDNFLDHPEQAISSNNILEHKSIVDSDFYSTIVENLMRK